MTDYEYDPQLPYVVTIDGVIQARFRSYSRAGEHAADLGHFRARVIDTTPKPRVPDDANYIVWWDVNACPRFACRVMPGSQHWRLDDQYDSVTFESLPGVTPETEFTVLDERKS